MTRRIMSKVVVIDKTDYGGVGKVECIPIGTICYIADAYLYDGNIILGLIPINKYSKLYGMCWYRDSEVELVISFLFYREVLFIIVKYVNIYIKLVHIQ